MFNQSEQMKNKIRKKLVLPQRFDTLYEQNARSCGELRSWAALPGR
jgi:hypothetical protein